MQREKERGTEMRFWDLLGAVNWDLGRRQTLLAIFNFSVSLKYLVFLS